MDPDLLNEAVLLTRNTLVQAITTSKFDGDLRENGLKAKESCIRSGRHIAPIHEAIKQSVHNFCPGMQVFPPIGETKPELTLFGYRDKKRHDLVFMREPMQSEILERGPCKGETDNVGYNAMRSSIVLGVRSQFSSVAKNRSTLMDRAFAEPDNLHDRVPEVRTGYVIVLPVRELNEQAMLNNHIIFKSKNPKVMLEYSKRLACLSEQPSQSVAMLVVNLDGSTSILWTAEDLYREFGIPTDIGALIQPHGFVERLLIN